MIVLNVVGFRVSCFFVFVPAILDLTISIQKSGCIVDSDVHTLFLSAFSPLYYR